MGTYRATILVAASERNVHAVLILAGAAQVVTDNFNVEVEVSISGGLIMEDGDPGRAVLLSNTNVDRSPVADVFTRVTPLAGFLGGDALRVDIVLGRSIHPIPAIIFSSIRAGKRLLGAGGRS